MTEARTDPDLLYVGTYTESVYLVRMDRRSGELMRVASASAGANPSFLTIHPNRRVLYAVNELDKGAVSASTIDRASGALTRLNEQPSEGGAPCYVSVDRSGRALLVANYAGGNVGLLPIGPDGALAPAHMVQHTGKGPTPSRQEAPHAHCIVPDPTNRFALAADLGADRVFVYGLDLGGKALRPVGEAVMRPGAGPRHIAFHPTLPLVFVANELDSTVATLRFDSGSGTLSRRARIRPFRPDGPARITRPTSTSRHLAAPCMCRTAATTALGVCHRGVDGRARARAGGLHRGRLAAQFHAAPTERWLLVANQRSNSVIVFERDPANGRLTLTQQKIEIPSPVCLRFA